MRQLPAGRVTQRRLAETAAKACARRPRVRRRIEPPPEPRIGPESDGRTRSLLAARLGSVPSSTDVLCDPHVDDASERPEHVLHIGALGAQRKIADEQTLLTSPSRRDEGGDDDSGRRTRARRRRRRRRRQTARWEERIASVAAVRGGVSNRHTRAAAGVVERIGRRGGGGGRVRGDARSARRLCCCRCRLAVASITLLLLLLPYRPSISLYLTFR